MRIDQICAFCVSYEIAKNADLNKTKAAVVPFFPGLFSFHNLTAAKPQRPQHQMRDTTIINTTTQKRPKQIRQPNKQYSRDASAQET